MADDLKITFCPRCDKPFITEELASKHMDLAHPDMINIFKEED